MTGNLLKDWCLSAEAKLPRQRTTANFVQYLDQLFAAHRSAIVALGSGVLEQQIQSALPAIDGLMSGLLEAVREYLRGILVELTSSWRKR